MNSGEKPSAQQLIDFSKAYGFWARTRAGENVKVSRDADGFFGVMPNYPRRPEVGWTGLCRWSPSGRHELARCDDLVLVAGTPTEMALDRLPSDAPGAAS